MAYKVEFCRKRCSFMNERPQHFWQFTFPTGINMSENN
jgi:hypothetical protein